MPAIMAESMQTAMDVTRQNMDAAMKRFQERMTEILKESSTEKN
jgi:hypothetical protein